MKGINPIGNLFATPQTEEKTGRNGVGGFAKTLQAAVNEVNEKQNAGDKAVEQVVKGDLGIHEGMLKLQEADLSLRLFLQVRSKIMDAYREIMRMQ